MERTKPRLNTPPGSLLPFLVFQGFQEAGADARGRSNLFQCDFAKLALTLQTFSEISPGHAVSL